MAVYLLPDLSAQQPQLKVYERLSLRQKAQYPSPAPVE